MHVGVRAPVTYDEPVEPVWKSSSESGAPDISSRTRFAATTWPHRLDRAVRDPRHRTPSRRRRGDGVEVDACPTQVLGAFTTTFGSFLIPALAWNLYYNSDERVKQMPKPIALGLQVPTVKVMNWVFILIILVLGLGLGGWASIKTMDEKVKEFELFDRCNGC